jgi:hypothetical protein
MLIAPPYQASPLMREGPGRRHPAQRTGVCQRAGCAAASAGSVQRSQVSTLRQVSDHLLCQLFADTQGTRHF